MIVFVVQKYVAVEITLGISLLVFPNIFSILSYCFLHLLHSFSNNTSIT